MLKRRIWAWGVIVIVAPLFTMSAKADEKPKWGKVTPEEWRLKPPAAYPEAKAVIIFDYGSLEISTPYEGNTNTFKRHKRIKAFNKAGADQAASVEIFIFPEDRLTNFGAQTILPNGKKHSISQGDTFTKKLGKDRKLITFTFPAVEDSCILEYRYHITDDRFHFLEPWYFQDDLYTTDSDFELMIPTGLNYSVVSSNIPEELRSPKREEIVLLDQLVTRFTWHLHDLYPIKTEPYMAAVNSYRSALHFQLTTFRDQDNNITFVKDWPTLGRTVAHDYLASNIVRDKGVAETAAETVKDLPSDMEKAKRLYEYVRDQIQTSEDMDYFLFFEPLSDIIRQKRGTATGKNVLLMEMMKASGIDAKPLLIGSRDFAVFNPAIYQLTQFDHLLCLVQLPEATYILDTQDRWVPFPHLPANSLVSGGFLIDGKDSRPINITHPKRPSGFFIKSKLTVHADGSGTCTTHVAVAGHLISSYRDLFQEKPSIDVLKRATDMKAALKCDLLEYSYRQLPEVDSVVVDMVIDLPEFCGGTDHNLVLEPHLFTKGDNPFKNPHRSFPVDFNYTFMTSEEIDIAMDEGLTLITVPEDLDLRIDGIRFVRSTISAGNTGRIMTQLAIQKSIFPPSRYSDIRMIFEKMSQTAFDKVVIALP